MTVLLAGGAGYIGSHTAVQLINEGYDVIIADNYYNSSPEVINRIEKITGTRPLAYNVDIKDTAKTLEIFTRNKIDCVIHFAGLKAVGESVAKPLMYYRNNIDTTLSLLECMRQTGVKNFIFSSSRTVYGGENPYPYIETMKRGSCSSPYGWTKFMMEQILQDAAAADMEMSVVLLRYFNPIGAHESGLIGEDPQGVPNNLMPFIAQTAVGKRDHLTVFGGDYNTPDGTNRRDYLHVMDLADGHVRAIEYSSQHTGCEIFNLGTGTPYSVLEMVHAFEEANGIKVPYVIGGRRAGDLDEFWADASKAEKVLGWKATRTLTDMCRDTWNWQKKNPKGYKE